jgi:FkbM family methyltransferase
MNDAPFGALAPNSFERAIMALTARMPDNWAGLKLAMALRRLVTMRMATAAGRDVERWRLRMRLHPRDNGCEKNLLFTPQMYEPPERAELAREIARVAASGRPFVFVDIGANVGLFSLFVAATAPAARILAIEPEPGNFARLAFNIAANPGLPITPLALALGEGEGTAFIMLNARDRGGTRVAAGGTPGGVAVRCRPLLAVLGEAGLTAIDALKIDVEGAEDKVLTPFFRDAPAALRPDLIVIEDSSAEWSTDLFALLASKGYAVSSRTRQNVMLRRGAAIRGIG